jgi:hypothetical protein
VTSAPGVVWTEANILDVNGNGLNDLVCASPQRIDLFNGTGGPLLDPSVYILNGTPSLLSFGDFDGDLLTDLAFKEEFAATKPDSLSLMWGGARGVFEDAISVGRPGKIGRMQTAALSTTLFTTADGISDIGVLGKSVDGTRQFVSVLAGSSDRLLQSPLTVSRPKPTGGPVDALVYSAVHAFAVANLTNDPAKFQDPHVDLAIIAYDIGTNAQNVQNEVHAYLVPVTTNTVSGDAQVDLTTATASDVLDVAADVASCGTKVDWRTANLVGVDLDGDGLDEVLLLAQACNSGDQGALYVLRVKGGKLVADPPQAIGTTGDEAWRIRLANVTGNGSRDVLTVLRDGSALTAQVRPNTKTGALGPPIAVPVPNGATLVSVTPLNADDDPQDELAILTDQGLFLADAKTSGQGTTLTLATSPAINVTNGKLLAAGDVNGDGVDDIAVVTNDSLVIYPGKAVVP